MKYTGYYVINNLGDIVNVFDYYKNAKEYIKKHPKYRIEKRTIDLSNKYRNNII